MQHFKLDNLAGELMNHKKLDGSCSRKVSSSPTNLPKQNLRSSRHNLNSSFNRRNLSAESLQNKSNIYRIKKHNFDHIVESN